MITDLIKYILFSLLINPMIVVGIVVGAYVMHYYNFDNLHYILVNQKLIMFILCSAVLYAVAFTHVYYTNSVRINWKATLSKIFSHLFTIAVAALFTCSLIYIINGISGGKMDSYLRYKRVPTAVSTVKKN